MTVAKMLTEGLQAINGFISEVFVDNFTIWVAFGFVAQMMFFMRFFIQWLASERAKKSIIPTSFWIFSLLGGIMLLIYAIQRRDPVFITGQLLGLFVYVRNIYFIYQEKLRSQAKSSDSKLLK